MECFVSSNFVVARNDVIVSTVIRRGVQVECLASRSLCVCVGVGVSVCVCV